MHLRFAAASLRVSSKHLCGACHQLRIIPLKPCLATARLVLLFAMWRDSAGRQPASPRGATALPGFHSSYTGQWGPSSSSTGRPSSSSTGESRHARGKTRAAAESSSARGKSRAAAREPNDSDDERVVFSGETREDAWAWERPDPTGC